MSLKTVFSGLKQPETMKKDLRRSPDQRWSLLCDRWKTPPSRRAEASVGAGPVEVLQHGGVGSLKQPLLAGGGRLAGVHEDAALAGAAVDAAVADRVVQALVLQEVMQEVMQRPRPLHSTNLNGAECGMLFFFFIHCLFNSMPFLLDFCTRSSKLAGKNKVVVKVRLPLLFFFPRVDRKTKRSWEDESRTRLPLVFKHLLERLKQRNRFCGHNILWSAFPAVLQLFFKPPPL